MHVRAVPTTVLLAAALALAGCGGGAGDGGAASGTVLDVARAKGLSRFVEEVDAAGLTQTLAGPGPFTVFAPTNRAFDAARLPGDPGDLRALMRYHVVPGDYTPDFLAGTDLNYTTAAGAASVAIDGRDGLAVNGVRVTNNGWQASNGVVYSVGSVLKRP